MFGEISLASIRHGLTAAGPLIVAYTPVTGSEWDQLVGALMTAAGLLWSIYRKIANKPRAL